MVTSVAIIKLLNVSKLARFQNSIDVPELINTIEGDMRLFRQIHHSALQAFQHAIVISNVTNVNTILLCFTSNFADIGLKEIWVLYGPGEKERYLPLHAPEMLIH